MRKILGILILAGVLQGCSKPEDTKMQEPNTTLDIPTILINKDNQLFINHYWPQIKNACQGIDTYASDLQFEGVDESGFQVLVSQQPKNTNLIRYSSFGNRCFFDISNDGKSLKIPKVACKSLCLDRFIDRDDPLFDGELSIDLKPLPLAEDDGLLTDGERKQLTFELGFSLGAMGQQELVEKITSEYEAVAALDRKKGDEFLMSSFRDSLKMLTDRAKNKSYQDQKNLAFSFATLSPKFGGDPISGCAWYLVVLSSGDTRVDAIDEGNVETYCSNPKLTDDQRLIAFGWAKDLYREIYGDTRRFEQFYGVAS